MAYTTENSFIIERDKNDIFKSISSTTEQYSCKCGKVHGRDNIFHICDQCGETCQKKLSRWIVDKGIVGQRLHGPRALNDKEKKFYKMIVDAVYSNRVFMLELYKSSFLCQYHLEILNCLVTECEFVNNRIRHPENYKEESDVLPIYTAIYNYLDYLLNYVTWYPAQKAIETLYQDSIDYYLENVVGLATNQLELYIAIS